MDWLTGQPIHLWRLEAGGLDSRVSNFIGKDESIVNASMRTINIDAFLNLGVCKPPLSDPQYLIPVPFPWVLLQIRRENNFTCVQYLERTT